MKGIVLAGGSGTRLYPITFGVSKQLLPIYDKPMIYYPLSVLMLAEIRDIMIITTPEDQQSFKRLLGNGKDFGVRFTYAVQQKPEGIAQAFLIGKEFIENDNVALILGDNIFYGANLSSLVKNATKKKKGATVFGYYVCDPERFGVVEFDGDGKAVSVEEKPRHPKSNYAVTGLYFYDNDVVKITEKIKPSSRGELEITSINNEYLKRGNLHVEKLDRGYAWLDTGTHKSMLDAANFINAIETRQGMQVACLQEIAYNNGWMTAGEICSKIENMQNTEYGKYLFKILKEN